MDKVVCRPTRKCFVFFETGEPMKNQPLTCVVVVVATVEMVGKVAEPIALSPCTLNNNVREHGVRVIIVLIVRAHDRSVVCA